MSKKEKPLVVSFFQQMVLRDKKFVKEDYIDIYIYKKRLNLDDPRIQRPATNQDKERWPNQWKEYQEKIK